METPQKRPTGMVGFSIVWIGQVVSLLGTAMSNFALTLWAYEVTGKATPLALVGFFFVTPMVVLGLGQTLPVWAAGIFLMAFFGPFINGSNQALWQAKVAPDVQGRVFTTRRLIAWLVSPISQLLAGPLADRALEPAMAEGGSLTPVFSWLVGTGTGAGMGLLFVFAGLLAALTGLSGYFFPVVRNAEDILPDHDAVVGQT